MRKSLKRSALIVTLALASVLSMGSIALAQGNGPVAGSCDVTDLPELTTEEADGLIFMVEEEKLARDVYLTLGESLSGDEIGDVRIFDNIARSEQKHIDAVSRLADAYDLDLPADNGRGQFTNIELQNLYDKLVALGEQSLADALRVGAAIEEIDILDLHEYLAETDNTAIERVYSNLLRGSENHLRAFVSTLERETGETYEPQYMEQSAYDDILDSSGRGRGRGSNGGQSAGPGRGNSRSEIAGSELTGWSSGKSGRW